VAGAVFLFLCREVSSLRYRGLLVVLMGVLLLAGCAGEDGTMGLQGLQGDPGTPQPIKLLIFGTETEIVLKEMIVSAYDQKLFPLGTTIDFWSLQSGLPPVSGLLQHDVVLAFTNATPANSVAIGDRLAEYIDAGGRLVITQGALSDAGTSLGPIEGRIMSPGYSPLQPGPGSGVIDNRKIDFTSLSFPLHPIFNGTNVLDLCFLSQPNFSRPVFDPGATLIATDTECNAASTTNFFCIAINANRNIMALNIFPGWHLNADLFPEYPQLIANSLMYVAGAF
jgi:hypothetical protein